MMFAKMDLREGSALLIIYTLVQHWVALYVLQDRDHTSKIYAELNKVLKCVIFVYSVFDDDNNATVIIINDDNDDNKTKW